MNEPMSLQEIADQMGISKQMVYKIEQRALRKARAILEAHGYTMRDLINGDNRKINKAHDTE